MNPNYEKIPQELRCLKQWVYWKFETKPNGEKTKVPKCPNGFYNASTTNPATWSTFDHAIRASSNGDGIGFVFTAESGYVGLDIDHATEPEIVAWFDTYAEHSQSGKGVHVIMKGTLPEYMGKKEGQGRRSGQFELYDRGRYFCMTGDIVHPEPIKECQDKLNEFIASVFTPVTPKQPEPPVKGVDISAFLKPSEEPDLLDQIKASVQGPLFQDLWSGGNGHHPSGSEGDMALLSILRWWTCGKQDEAYRLLKQSPRYTQRKAKLDRTKYLDDTWNLLEGDVRTEIEYLPPIIIKAKSAAPWRKISIEHVREAISDTILEPMTDALRSPTLDPLPLEIALAKALSLCGCALSGKAEKPRTFADYVGFGKALARLRIMTGGGQIANFWTLTVGRSSSGKDIGGIMIDAARQFKWIIGGAGSEEGIADAYIRNPNGLLTISEMMNWLNPNHWQSRASGFLTSAFNQGCFTYALSKRGDAPPRETNYCYPNICAAVQPGVLQEYATPVHVESGFLGRFLIIQTPSFDVYPSGKDLMPQIRICINILKRISMLEGDIIVPDYYNRTLNNMFGAEKAEPEPSWRRIAAEYYPRLAVLLSMPATGCNDTATITEKGWGKAHILAQYFFKQAEEVFGTMHFDPIQSRFERLCSRILAIIQNSPEHKCWKYEISQATGNGTRAKDRDEALRELQERGLIISEKPKDSHTGTRYIATSLP